MSEQRRAIPQPGNTFKVLTTIHNHRASKIDAANKEADKKLTDYVQAATEGADKDQKGVFSRDVTALQRVFPDIMEAVKRSELSPRRTGDYLGPIEEPRRVGTGVENFIGGLSIAA